MSNPKIPESFYFICYSLSNAVLICYVAEPCGANNAQVLKCDICVFV
jgi:hypothetical protein